MRLPFAGTLSTKLRLRKIRKGRLLVSGLVYRSLVVCCDAIFLAVAIDVALDRLGNVGTAVTMNIMTLIVYYAYHYAFARLFKLGINDDGEEVVPR